MKFQLSVLISFLQLHILVLSLPPAIHIHIVCCLKCRAKPFLSHGLSEGCSTFLLKIICFYNGRFKLY